MKRQRMWTQYGLAVPLMLAVAGCAAVPTPAPPPPRPAPVAAAPTPAPLPTPTRGWEERAVESGRLARGRDELTFAVVELKPDGGRMVLQRGEGAGDSDIVAGEPPIIVQEPRAHVQ